MRKRLVALVESQKVGEFVYDEKKDRVSWVYESSWVESEESFPLSLSMPMVKREYGDDLVRSFIQSATCSAL